MFLGLPDPDPFVRGMDPDLAPNPDGDPSINQGFGSVFIFYGSGSGSRGSGWRPIRIRIRIRIQSGSRALMTKNFFLIKNCNLPIPSLHKVCPGYRKSLQLTKEAIQHFKTWIFSTFVGHFCPPGSGSVFKLRIRIRIQWSDWIRIQYGSGSGYGSGSETLLSTIKNIKKILVSYCFVTSFGLYLWKMMYMFLQRLKNFFLN